MIPALDADNPKCYDVEKVAAPGPRRSGLTVPWKGCDDMLNIPSHDWRNVDSPWIGTHLSTWSHLTAKRIPLKYPPKSMVYSQGDRFSKIYIVASGRVRISIFHRDGQEKQLYIAGPGAMFGESACILEKPHASTATTITRCELYAIPSKEVQRLFHTEARTADLMLQYEARKNRLLTAQVAMLSFDRAEQRVAKVLLYLCEMYGRQEGDGVRIDLRFTCADIAALVNTSRVTVNNVIQEFIRSGILTKDGSFYIVQDPHLLQISALQMLDE